MGTIQEVTLIAGSQDQVWKAVVDYPARTRWWPRVKEARLLDEGPLQVGSRIRLKVDKDQFTSTVVEVHPPERLVLLVKGPGFRVTHSYRLQPTGVKTEVTMSGEYGGLIGSLVVRFMQRSVRRDLTDELAALKGAAEASSAE
ncbi:MAG: hypothetical protein EXR53_02400 [Dehalococcoidia bacterium]|nr:hypothetical protein [Dehalococcoidia bacterium]